MSREQELLARLDRLEEIVTDLRKQMAELRKGTAELAKGLVEWTTATAELMDKRPRPRS